MYCENLTKCAFLIHEAGQFAPGRDANMPCSLSIIVWESKTCKCMQVHARPHAMLPEGFRNLVEVPPR